MVTNCSKIYKEKWHLAIILFKSSRVLLDLQSLAKKRNYVRKRWRLAFATIICCSRVLSSLTTKRRIWAYQRWRGVLCTMHCLRVLISLAAKKNQPPRHWEIDIPSSSGLFNIDRASLTKLVKEKNMDSLREFGGVRGVVRALLTHAQDGIHGDVEDLRHRCRDFGSNTYICVKCFYNFLPRSCEGIMDLFIAFVFVPLFLGYGIKKYGVKDGWQEGGHMFIAGFVIFIASFILNFGVEKYLEKALKVSSNNCLSSVDVVRNGLKQQISVPQIVVGDVVYLEEGDQVPADGLFLNGQSLKVDESSLSAVNNHVEVNCNLNPFLFSGTEVIGGHAQMLVTTVGLNTVRGEKTINSINHSERTSIQAKVHKLILFVKIVSSTFAAIIMAVLFAYCFSGNLKDDEGNGDFTCGTKHILDDIHAILIIIVVTCIIAPAIESDSFSDVVSISLGRSLKRMIVDKVSVRKHSACETMGSVKTILILKTGTLNQLKVATFWQGQESLQNESNFSIAPNVLELIKEGVGLTTRSEYEFSDTNTTISKAILSWAKLELKLNLEELKQACTVLHVEAFNPEKQRSGVLIRKNPDNTIHMHWNGASDVILAMCSSYYDASGIMIALDDGERMKLEHIIQRMTSSNLQCIAFAHAQVMEEEVKEDCLILLGLVELKGSCQVGVEAAVKTFLKAGVNIKMITGDDIPSARATATECGILEPNQDMNSAAVVEGEQFQNYTLEDKMKRIEEIRVMARSSPSDKLLMVQCLKQKGHVIAVGNGRDDVMALTEADVGLFMGIDGDKRANERSDLVILDDNFASVTTVVKWGRSVLSNTQKFIQFQLTAGVISLLNTFIVGVSSSQIVIDNMLAYTLVQVIWVNLVLGMFAAVALGTEPPSEELMQKPPVDQTAPLITNTMWRNITAQVVYRAVILQVLQFWGELIFQVSSNEIDTMSLVINIFCQVFNLFNARKLEEVNIFSGIGKNRLFIAIVVTIIILQSLMVEIFQKILDLERLNWKLWMACIGLAFVSWPLDFAVKFVPVPDKPFLNYLHPFINLARSMIIKFKIQIRRLR